MEILFGHGLLMSIDELPMDLDGLAGDGFTLV